MRTDLLDLPVLEALGLPRVLDEGHVRLEVVIQVEITLRVHDCDEEDHLCDFLVLFLFDL